MAIDDYAALPDRWTDAYGQDPDAFPGKDDPETTALIDQYQEDPASLSTQEPPQIVDGTVRFVAYEPVPAKASSFGGTCYVEKEVTDATPHSSDDPGSSISYQISDRSRELVGAAIIQQVREAFNVSDKEAVLAILDE